MPDTINRSIDLGADSLSVFFPCYNEEDNIPHVYESAIKVLTNSGVDYELILVDDGSTDQTPPIADAIAAADPREGCPPLGQSRLWSSASVGLLCRHQDASLLY